MKLEEQIGLKLKDLRNQNGLTQEELADRTELTKGFISQLERGLTAPSVATLVDIVEALGSNLSDFFYEEQARIVYPKEDYFEKTDDNGNVTKWLLTQAQSCNMEPILIHIEKGNSLQKDKPHSGEEFGYVLKGRIVVHYGQESKVVKEGDSFHFRADKIHWLSSGKNTASDVLWISSPPSF